MRRTFRHELRLTFKPNGQKLKNVSVVIRGGVENVGTVKKRWLISASKALALFLAPFAETKG